MKSIIMSIINTTIFYNITNSDKRDENLAVMEVSILASIFILIIIGNLCVLVALGVKRFKMTRMYYFLLHLCISDIITACFTVMPQLAWDITHRFNGGNILCKLIKCLQLFGPYLSSYVLVVTAIDRYQAICFPLSNCQWTSRKSKLMITIAWIISILCSIPQAFIFSYQQIPDSNGVRDCWGTFPEPYGERIYVTWYAISVFFIPLIIITYTYVYICREVWANARLKRQTFKPEISLIEVRRNWGRSSSNRKSDKSRLQNQSEVNSDISVVNNILNPRSHSIYRISKAKIKTVKVTVVVVICYIVCSSPFICVQVWSSWIRDPSAQETSFWTGPIVTILMLLSSLNSAVNPWIYLLFNQNLMNALRSFCCCGRRTNQNQRTLRGSRLDSTRETKLESEFTQIETNCSNIRHLDTY